MFQKDVVIRNKAGLHARPASQLVNEASKFESQIRLVNDANEEVDAKSILGIMAMAIQEGAKLTIKAQGSDEEAAVTKLVPFIESLAD